MSSDVVESCAAFSVTDVQRDGSTAPIDALLIINSLNSGSAYQPELDVDGSGAIEPLDALITINAINAQVASDTAVIRCLQDGVAMETSRYRLDQTNDATSLQSGTLFQNDIAVAQDVNSLGSNAFGLPTYSLNGGQAVSYLSPTSTGVGIVIIASGFTKYQIVDSVHYGLNSQGWLYINGQPSYAKTKDFFFSQGNKLHTLNVSGLLERRDGSNWIELDTDVRKYWVNSDSVWTFGRDGIVATNGEAKWSGILDFELIEETNELVALNNSGLLEVRGSDLQWRSIVPDAISFWVNGGRVWSVGRDGSLRTNGEVGWSRIENARMSPGGQLFVLNRGGLLERREPNFTWTKLDEDCIEFYLSGESVISRGRDGWANIDGVPYWANTEMVNYVDGVIFWASSSVASRHPTPLGDKPVTQIENVRNYAVLNGRLFTIASDNVFRIDGIPTLWDINTFEIAGFQITLHRFDRVDDVFDWRFDIQVQIAQKANTSSGQVISGIRGITGNVLSPSQLNSMGIAPDYVLKPVVKIENRDGSVGSGTILDYGGNRFVLTAAHVVEHKTSTGFAIDPSKLRITFEKLNGQKLVYHVRSSLGRDIFGNSDIALLELELGQFFNDDRELVTNPIPAVDGAILSSNTSQVGKNNPVISVGYGLNNNIYKTSASFDEVAGQRNGGQRSVEETIDNPASEKLPDGTPIPGRQLKFLKAAQGVGTESGDSGGPDFVYARTESGKSIAYLVGVHSYGTPSLSRNFPEVDKPIGYSDFNDPSYSVLLMPDMVTKMQKWILSKYQPSAPTLKVGALVFHAGDGRQAHDPGEWKYTLQLSGGASLLHRPNEVEVFGDFSQGQAYTLGDGIRFIVGREIRIEFFGSDSDFFFSTDPLPSLDTRFAISETTPIGRKIALSSRILGSSTDLEPIDASFWYEIVPGGGWV